VDEKLACLCSSLRVNVVLLGPAFAKVYSPMTAYINDLQHSGFAAAPVIIAADSEAALTGPGGRSKPQD
jgi:hypothetical protein